MLLTYLTAYRTPLHWGSVTWVVTKIKKKGTGIPPNPNDKRSLRALWKAGRELQVRLGNQRTYIMRLCTEPWTEGDRCLNWHPQDKVCAPHHLTQSLAQTLCVVPKSSRAFPLGARASISCEAHFWCLTCLIWIICSWLWHFQNINPLQVINSLKHSSGFDDSYWNQQPWNLVPWNLENGEMGVTQEASWPQTEIQHCKCSKDARRHLFPLPKKRKPRAREWFVLFMTEPGSEPKLTLRCSQFPYFVLCWPLL